MRGVNTTVVTRAVAALLLTAIALAAHSAGTPAAVLESVSGDVQIMRAGRPPWLSVRSPAHKQLYAGDHLRTLLKSTAVIVVGGARVSVGPGTHIAIPHPKRTAGPAGESAIKTIVGKVYIWLIGARGFEVRSDGATAAAGGTRFVFEVAEDATTTCTVTEGVVRFFNAAGEVALEVNQQSVALPGTPPSRPRVVDPSGLIDWEASIDGVRIGWEALYFPTQTDDQLRARLETLAAAAASAPDTVLEAARIQHDLGEYALAEQLLAGLLQRAPDSYPAHLCLGLTLLEVGRPTEALEAFTAAAKLEPKSVEAPAGIALSLLATGRPDAARAAVANAADSLPGQVALGLIAMRSGQLEPARAAFRRAASMQADAYLPPAYLAIADLAAGEVDSALRNAQRAVELAPRSALAHESLATVSFFSGDLDAAQAEADVALDQNPQSATAHLLASDILVARGDLDAGLVEAQAAVALDPMLGPAYSAMGMVYLARNALPQAETCFTRAIELTPGLVSARAGMGVTYARQGRLAEALQMQKAAVALDSSRASAVNNIGAIALAEGRLDEAEQQFNAAIALRGDWSLPHSNLALTYLDMNRFADAVREGELAVKLGENSARVHTTLGRVYIEQNRLNKAWAALRRAVQLDPDYALARLHLAEVYTRMGRNRDAVNHQLQAVSRQPSAILETREYSRTEVTASVGSFAADIKTDGRAADGALSYYAAAAYEQGDGGRAHSDYERIGAVGIVGSQTGINTTDALLAAWEHQTRQRPGRLIMGLPEDADYESDFDGWSLRYLCRRPSGRNAAFTLKLGYESGHFEESNPDSLLADPKQFRELKTQTSGPTAEMLYERRCGPHSGITAGVALSSEDASISGIVGTPDVSGLPELIAWRPFADAIDREAATFYLNARTRMGEKTELLAGARYATRRHMTPVLKPEGYIRHRLGDDGALVLLTRPVLRDDVSELSWVDDYSLREWISPLDLAMGGFSQSYELQYELTPPDGSLLRLSAFHRELRNYIVDLEDPAWTAGGVGMVLASGQVRGGEIEWERWIGNNLSAGIWVRYADSENDDAGGRDIPYQPDFSGTLRLDYIDRNGLRVGAEWCHIGERFADAANTVELDAHDVVSLRIAKQLSLQTDVFLTIENLLDEDYGFWQGYPAPGLRVRGGIQHRF